MNEIKFVHSLVSDTKILEVAVVPVEILRARLR